MKHSVVEMPASECTAWILQLDAGSKFQGSSSWRRDCGRPAAIFSSVLLSIEEIFGLE